jgi:hypothetical protein
MNNSAIFNLLDLNRYPINELTGSDGQNLIREIQTALANDGACTLPGFVRESVINKMAVEAKTLQPLAYSGPSEVSPYFFNYDLADSTELTEDHPLKRKGKRNLAQVATDLIPQDHLLSKLYYSSVLIEFLAAVLEKPVYRNQDKYQSLNISIMNKGGCQQWHFDSGSMVTTLLLQAPEAGGVFEYVPEIRSDENENFNEVQKVLDGDLSRARQNKLETGTLSLFRGHYSMHRVTEVQGSRNRIQAILGFSPIPGLHGNLESSILHYGPRVAALEGVELS